jgi:hypothetical protein
LGLSIHIAVPETHAIVPNIRDDVPEIQEEMSGQVRQVSCVHPVVKNRMLISA